MTTLTSSLSRLLRAYTYRDIVTLTHGRQLYNIKKLSEYRLLKYKLITVYVQIDKVKNGEQRLAIMEAHRKKAVNAPLRKSRKKTT
jgi:hypothetical protein